MKKTKQTIGQRIKELRESREMTQAEFAAKFSVSDKTVSKWEKGNSEPETDLLIKIAEFFEVTLDYLLTGSNKEQEDRTLTTIELACRDDNIALLNGIDLKAPDSTGKDINYYAKKYGSKNIQRFLLDLEIEESIKNKSFNKEKVLYVICAIPDGLEGDDNLVLLDTDKDKDEVAPRCAELERRGYKHFKIFKEVHLFDKVEVDYQWLDINFLDISGFHKMSMHIGLLDDMESGILGFSIYRDKTYFEKKTVNGHRVPDYYPKSDVEHSVDCYVKPSLMKELIQMLNEVDFKHWENKHWGCSLYNIFYALKEKEKPMYEKFYVAPGKTKFKRFVNELQKVCMECLEPSDYKQFTKVINVDYRPYFREGMHIIDSQKLFEEIEKEDAQIKEDHFDIF